MTIFKLPPDTTGFFIKWSDKYSVWHLKFEDKTNHVYFRDEKCALALPGPVSNEFAIDEKWLVVLVDEKPVAIGTKVRNQGMKFEEITEE